MKKRLISMLLVLVMVLSLFAGCGKKEAKGDNVLTVGMPQNASITSYEDNALTKYIMSVFRGLYPIFSFYSPFL